MRWRALREQLRHERWQLESIHAGFAAHSPLLANPVQPELSSRHSESAASSDSCA